VFINSTAVNTNVIKIYSHKVKKNRACCVEVNLVALANTWSIRYEIVDAAPHKVNGMTFNSNCHMVNRRLFWPHHLNAFKPDGNPRPSQGLKSIEHHLAYPASQQRGVRAISGIDSAAP
jgi:hypothetical protein